MTLRRDGEDHLHVDKLPEAPELVTLWSVIRGYRVLPPLQEPPHYHKHHHDSFSPETLPFSYQGVLSIHSFIHSFILLGIHLSIDSFNKLNRGSSRPSTEQVLGIQSEPHTPPCPHYPDWTVNEGIDKS